MPKIKSFTDLLKVFAGLFVTSLAISSFITIPGRVGLVSTIASPGFAETFYEIYGSALLVICYIIYIGGFLFIPYFIWNYCHNRPKSSDDLSITISENSLKSINKQVHDLKIFKAMLDKYLSSMEEQNSNEDNET